MFIVAIQRIHRTGSNRKRSPTRDIEQFSFPGDAVVSLQMFLVLEVQLRTFLHHRVVKRVTHSIITQNQPATAPARSTHIPLGSTEFVHGAYDH